MKKLVLALLMAVLSCGCGGNSSSSGSLVRVTVNPSTPANIDQGQTLQFTASVSGDPANKGVTWTATGPGCAGAACGTFTGVTATSATYHAPTTVSTGLSVTVTATSVAASTSSASAIAFNVMPALSIVTTDLTTATPSNTYNTTLQGAGGVQPLSWSVASGALPAGLTLNSAGIIYGIPTAGGASTFTLKVTDSSGSGAVSAQQSFTLTVIGVLTIPAAVLPDGTVGSAYSATLPFSGGTPPLIWAIYSGSLPSGLVLQQSSGVIAGTPTLPGTYSFTVSAVDSSPAQQTDTSSTITITVKPAGALTIRTTSLLDGVVSTPYQGNLVATGGAPPLVWSVTTGALPTGLALNPATGTIAGTPTATAGTYSFTVAVTDASSPQQTATQALSITVDAGVTACSSSGNNSLLVGQYAFSLRGYNGAGFLAVVGSFKADGTGKITAGEADTNGVLGAQSGNVLTAASSYSVGPDNRGCATLATPFGTFYTRFAVGAVSARVATQGRIIEFDNPSASAYVAAGQILQQSPAAFISPLTGSYALRTSGWDPSTSGRIACVGIVTGSSYVFSYLEEDCNDNGTVSNTTNITTTTTTTINTYSTADTNGRGTATLSVGGNTSGLAFYWVSSTQLFVINSDSSPTFSGEWRQENVPLGAPGFNQASFDGTVATYSSGLGASGAAGDVSIGTESADGISSVTTHLYQDGAGTWQTTNTTCNYSVVTIGRMTLGGGTCGSNPPIPYMNSLNTAFVLGTASTIDLGTFEPQQIGLTNVSLAGTYYVGTSEVVNQAVQAEVGIATLTSTGIIISTTDSASTLSQTAGTNGSDTYSLHADGTFSTGSSGGTTVGVAISNGKFVLVNDPTLTFPSLLIGQQ